MSEARNIATFSSYLDQNDLRRIATAPFVYSQLTSKRWAHCLTNQRIYQLFTSCVLTGGTDVAQCVGDGIFGGHTADRSCSHPERHSCGSRASAHQVRSNLPASDVYNICLIYYDNQ